MIINHNMNAMNAHRNMGINNTNSGKSMEKLSSGLRINRAGDDAAGLAISEKMRGQIRGLDQASRNSQDGISLIQTAEGALNESHSILQRMRELAVQAGNDTNTTDDRAQIQEELNQLTSEINRIGNTTEFNTQKLLNGNKAGNATAAGATIVGSGTKAEITFDIKAGATGGIQIDSTAVTVDAGGAGKSDAFIAKLAASDTLTAKYEFTKVDDDTIKITVKDTSTAVDAVGTIVAGGSVENAKVAVKGTADKVATDAIEGKVKLQIGANEGQSLSIEIADMRAEALGISTTTKGADGYTATETVSDGTKDTNEECALDVSTHDNAANAVTKYDNALNTVSSQRAKLGALQNRLEHTIANLGTSSENLTAAESRVRDVDMAKEMMTFSKNNILQQAAQSMLAQANQQPQQVLSLLR